MRPGILIETMEGIVARDQGKKGGESSSTV